MKPSDNVGCMIVVPIPLIVYSSDVTENQNLAPCVYCLMDLVLYNYMECRLLEPGNYLK